MTKPHFWEAGINLMEKDVEEFIHLTNKMMR